MLVNYQVEIYPLLTLLLELHRQFYNNDNRNNINPIFFFNFRSDKLTLTLLKTLDLLLLRQVPRRDCGVFNDIVTAEIKLSVMSCWFKNAYNICWTAQSEGSSFIQHVFSIGLFNSTPNMSSLLYVVLCAIASLCMATPTKDQSFDLRLVHTNDMHSRFEQVRKQTTLVFLLSKVDQPSLSCMFLSSHWEHA